jgi:hypothetical protein
MDRREGYGLTDVDLSARVIDYDKQALNSQCNADGGIMAGIQTASSRICISLSATLQLQYYREYEW